MLSSSIWSSQSTGEGRFLGEEYIGWFAILGSLGIPLMWIVLDLERRVDFEHPFINWVVSAILSVVIVSLMVSLVDIFSARIYPTVPQQFGGGRPREVRLLVSSQYSNLLGGGEVNIMDSPSVSKELDLLWEMERAYVVRVSDDSEGSIILIDKSAVIAVIGQPRSDGLTGMEGQPQATPMATPTVP